MNDICIISVYFGKFDTYIDLWAYTASKNDNIDFLIITDNTINFQYSNIKVINMSFQDFHKLAESKLKMKLCLKKPYKLCDFKPAYGLILNDYLNGYSYWGHCDFDIIWGDLTYFFEKYNYNEYEKFLDRGHLTLYKNTPRMNNIFKAEVKGDYNYKTVFTNPHSYLFDENKEIKDICEQENVQLFNKRIAADIDYVHKRFRHAFGDTELTKNYNQQIFYYQNGHIYMDYVDVDDSINRKEYAYIHLQKRKGLNIYINNYDSFYITNKGFIDKNSRSTVAIIQELNPFPGTAFEKQERNTYEKSVWKLKFKSKISKNIIGKQVVRLYNNIKYKFK